MTMTKKAAAARIAADKAALIASTASSTSSTSSKPKAKAKPSRVKSTVGAPAFAIGQGCRPVAGARLVAYTAAWLSMFALDSGKAAPRAALVKVAGQTAVAYHTRQGNMVQTADGITLTAKGKSVFAMRAIDAELKAAMMSVLKNGEPNKTAQVSKAQIVAVA